MYSFSQIRCHEIVTSAEKSYCICIYYIFSQKNKRTRGLTPCSDPLFSEWKFPEQQEGGSLCQEKTVYESVSKNPFLKVWVLCGYYDGATPFYGAEYAYNHVFLNDNLKDHVSFTYYPSGHMIYMERPCGVFLLFAANNE